MTFKKMTALLLCSVTLSMVSLNETSDAQAKTPTTRAILGQDNRVKVMDTTKAPYSSIVYLSTINGSYGSGTVIGKNKVLTAAHVVTNLKTNTEINQARVSPARNGYYYPFGSFKVESVDAHTGWTIQNNRDHDVAVVTLKPNSAGKNIGDVVPIIPVTNVPDLPTGTKGKLPGYSQDKHGELWEATGSVLSQTDSLLFYDMDSVGGTSGAPVFNQNNQLIAVHTSEYLWGNVPYKNAGSKITGSNYDFIAKHLEKEVADTQAPSQVTGVKAENVTTNSVQLSWNQATDNVGVEKYEIYRNGTKVGESKTTNFTINQLTADTTYNFVVRAVDKAGNRSAFSTNLSVRTKKQADIQAPSQVTGVNAQNITTNSVYLSWNSSTDNVGIEKYEVYRNGTKVGESKTTDYTAIQLTANTTYKFAIAAVDQSGNRSALSSELTVQTAKEPEKPTESLPTWEQRKVYVAGDKVIYNGITYRARWWTQANVPGKSEVWEKLSTDRVEEWQANLAYTGGNVVSYKGIRYKAKWWTRGEEPGRVPVWEKIN